MLKQADMPKKIWDIYMKSETQWNCGYADLVQLWSIYRYYARGLSSQVNLKF